VKTISIAESSSKILGADFLDVREANSLGSYWKEKLGLPSPAIQVTQASNGTSLRTDHVVGVLKVGQTLIEIFPKFLAAGADDEWHQPFLNLVRYAHGHVSRTADDISARITSRNSFTDEIGMIFNDELKYSYGRGLPRTYKERSGSSTIVEGALNLSKLNSLIVFDGKVHFRSPYLSNQSQISALIGWTAAKLATLCSDRALVSELLRWKQQFTELGNYRLPSNWRTISIPRSFSYLQSLVEIGQLLAGSQFPGVEFGESDISIPGFIWKTADVYERAIYRLNSESLKDTGVVVSKRSFPLLSTNGSSIVRTIPDLVYAKHGVSVLVGDAKYKNRKTGPETSDTYQVMAAADVTGCSRSVLFYPASGSEIKVKKLDVSGFGQAREIVVIDVGLDCFIDRQSLSNAKNALRETLVELLDDKQIIAFS
jgi:5-methylcytosine-specific restriction endonuclease McrBC regulatory subunit McrC